MPRALSIQVLAISDIACSRLSKRTVLLEGVMVTSDLEDLVGKRKAQTFVEQSPVMITTSMSVEDDIGGE